MDANEAIQTLEQFERLDDYQVREISELIMSQNEVITKFIESKGCPPNSRGDACKDDDCLECWKNWAREMD